MSKSLRQPLTPEELRELTLRLREAFQAVSELKKKPGGAAIQYPKLPSVLSELLVVHCGPALFPNAKNIHLGGGREADVVFDAANATTKVEVKATGSKEFQELGPRDVRADFLVWIAFGTVFENETEETVRIYVLDVPGRVFADGTKITLAKFKEQAAGMLTSYEAKLSDLIDGKVVRISQQSTPTSRADLPLGITSGGSFEEADNHTKIGTQVTALALELLAQNRDGIRYADLVRQISNEDAHLNVSTIRGNVWDLDAKFPDEVYKPARGIFRLIKFRDEETSELEISQGDGDQIADASRPVDDVAAEHLDEFRGAAEQGDEAAEAPSGSVYIGHSVKPEFIWLRLANRHGLITGATGSGKTVTLQVLAEGFSDHGVPVFCADVKGDLSGVAEKGEPKAWVEARAREIGYTVKYQAYPAIFWDLFGKRGHPVRATVSQIGPLLLSRLMNLNDTQEGVLNIAFKVAHDEKLPLIDLKDLGALLEDLAWRADGLTTKYGNLTKASIGSIQRALLVLEQQGADNFFGEPALRIADLMRLAPDGRGYISLLAADKLITSPKLYSTLLLFLLSELSHRVPVEGDLDKPKLVFFFSEAHFLFKDMPKVLLEKIEQMVRLLSSKGIGVYFETDHPLDIPVTLSRQFGNRIEHALRAFTPAEQKAVRSAANTFRKNPHIDTQRAIMELGLGEALVSTLDEKGEPSMVELTLVRPPNSRVGPITESERATVIDASPVHGEYEDQVDRVSAAELLGERTNWYAEAEVEATPSRKAEKVPLVARTPENQIFQEFSARSGAPWILIFMIVVAACLLTYWAWL